MATHTIGTGGDFSTPQAWEDDILSVLVADRIGQVKNEEIVESGTATINFSAHDTTLGEIILEAVSGGAWNDNANVATNGYRYNSSNGASLKNTVANSNEIVKFDAGGGTIADRLTIRNLQLYKNTSGSGDALAINYGESSQTVHHVYKNLIVQDDNNVAVISHRSNNALFINCLIIQLSGGSGAKGLKLAGTAIGCTVVRPSDITAASTGLDEGGGSTQLLTGNAVFGFTTDASGGFSSSSDYNATSLSDGASGLPDPASDHNQYSVAYTTATFVQPSNAGSVMDFRPVAAGALENTGIYDGTNSPSDAALVVRGNPPEIGARELAAAVALQNDYPFDVGDHFDSPSEAVAY